MSSFLVSVLLVVVEEVDAAVDEEEEESLDISDWYGGVVAWWWGRVWRNEGERWIKGVRTVRACPGCVVLLACSSLVFCFWQAQGRCGAG